MVGYLPHVIPALMCTELFDKLIEGEVWVTTDMISDAPWPSVVSTSGEERMTQVLSEPREVPSPLADRNPGCVELMSLERAGGEAKADGDPLPCPREDLH